jgi:hypothetical protein
MENNLFSEHQIEFMYSDPMFFRFVNDYFSSFSIQSSNFGMEMKNTDEMSETDMHIYIRIILANLAELRQMISEIEKSLSYTYKDSVQTFDGEIHGHLQVQRYLQLKTQIKYPKEYPCQIKKRTSVTPENIFLIYIVDYVIRLLDFFAKVLRNYIGNTYSTEKTLIDEYRRAFHAFSRKNYFRECALSLENIRKQYGDEFPANLLNLIKIRAAKGKIRNYQSYEKIFDWYWKYKQGTIEFDLLKTLRILRYSDDFCNRLFELWCLYSIKETFIKEFGMTLISERNIMDVGNQSVFTLKATNDGIVEIFYQKGAKLYWDEEAEPVWKYIDLEGKKKRLVGIPDISVKYSARTNSLVMIDLKNRIRTAGSNSEEIYKMIGYFSNFDNMFKRMYSESIKKQAILIYRNDYDAFSECLVSDTNNLLNTYSVCPTTKAKLNLLQFKAICQCILDTQGIDGKTSEVLGNYKKEKANISTTAKEDDEDNIIYTLSERNHKVISNLFSFGELAEELPKQMELLCQNYFPHIWNTMSEKTKEILAMADCLFSGMKECESADYAPICLEYCRGLEVQLNQLIFEPFRNSHNISNLVRRNRFYDKMQETREMTLGECVFFLEKCTHRNYPMIELKQYIDNIVHDSNVFFSVAVPIMKEINVNIRRLSAHTTIMTYDELVSTRQKILGIGYLNLFYQLLDQR